MTNRLEKIYAKPYLHQDDNKTLMVDAELQPYDGYELFIRADDDNVLPVIPNDWVLTLLANHFDSNGGDWYHAIVRRATPEGRYAESLKGEGDTPREAVLAAIANIRGE